MNLNKNLILSTDSIIFFQEKASTLKELVKANATKAA